ncbi:MAG: formate/nitrite transporter family protein [Verrucomicrobiota bacterium]|nr:formate/nitrite transporter family protein [Verrucomicrobiota bacterium]
MSRQTTSSKKEEEIVERTSPPGEIVYAAIYREGEHELKRNGGELALSGLAAGLSMGFSLVTEGLLRAHLPDAPWTILITKFGYSIGFLIVILGRQQLFTKNTLTIILPLLKKKELTLLGTVARLWAIVLFANLAGAFVFAWLLGTTSLFEEHTRQSFAAIATKAVEPSFGVILLRAILAGWLIALMIWLLPFADAARTWVIIIIAYVIGIAELPHVVAGNVESFYLLSTGALSLGSCLAHYLVPTLIGNVIGGVALVAVGAHAEFMEAGGA